MTTGFVERGGVSSQMPSPKERKSVPDQPASDPDSFRCAVRPEWGFVHHDPTGRVSRRCVCKRRSRAGNGGKLCEYSRWEKPPIFLTNQCNARLPKGAPRAIMQQVQPGPG